MLNSNGQLDIELEEQVYSLKEVTITSDRIANVRSNTLGVERVNLKEIKNVPTVFGEKDVIRIVMMLPGVKAVGEASSGFNVRGGSTDQNLIPIQRRYNLQSNTFIRTIFSIQCRLSKRYRTV